MSKKTMMKAKARVNKAKVKLAALKRRARKEAARMSASGRVSPSHGSLP